MGENGKRSRSHRDDSGSRNQKRRTNQENDMDGKGNDEMIVYRILCPDNVIGSVIGKNGKVINSIRQDTRAKVKVVDPFQGAKERVIIIYCYVKKKEEVEVDEELNNDEPLCPAQDALLKVHDVIARSINLASEAAAEADQRRKDRDTEECMLLVPSSQSANIIGKSGSTIKKLRNRTRTNIRVTAKDSSNPVHSCALEFDNFVLISGDAEGVKRALFAISAIMYKFTPKEDIPLSTSVPEAPPGIIIPADIPIYPASGLYPSMEHVNPGRSASSILGPTQASDIASYVDAGSALRVYSSALPMVSGQNHASRSELQIKVLCPSNMIGRVIGKGGLSIKSIRQDTGASIEVEDPKSNNKECVITVISTESSDDLKSMAVEAVLSLERKINNESDDTVSMRLLIPSRVIGCIIGKGGSIINEIRKGTKADVQISKVDKNKRDSDELVEIVGQVGCLRDALVWIVLKLRDHVLKDREDDHIASTGAEALYTGGTSISVPSALRSLPHSAALGYEQRADTGSGLGLLSSSAYGYASLPIVASRHGSLSSHSSSVYAGLPPPSILEMVIPGHAVGKVMGKGGTNIENIRKISGAAIEISDSRSSRGDRVAMISGSAEQKRAAENLIQAFIMAT